MLLSRSEPYIRIFKFVSALWLLDSVSINCDTAGQKPDVQELGTMVVTATRSETRLFETPQSVQVISSRDIAKTPHVDLTDLLKKTTSGIDVIQYPGLLSGIGLRGFRPEFSGISKRTLLLIDGRPAGTTNLSQIQTGIIERIEVLKGPASALYGPSAMGGVINVILKRSSGEITGKARAGYGYFDTRQFGFDIGGSLGPINFDYSGSYYDQDDNFSMGDGTRRANTSFSTVNNALRMGLPLGDNMNLEGFINSFFGIDVATPGDIAKGEGDQSTKDMDQYSGHIRLDGGYDWGDFKLTLFGAKEAYDLDKVTTQIVADRPYLPFKSFASDIGWWGAQAQTTIPWWNDQHNLIMGFDYEEVAQTTQTYQAKGMRTAPFSADLERRGWGIYAQNDFNFDWFGGSTVFTAGGRFDQIVLETLNTPLKKDFTPTQASFEVFNPRLGFSHLFTQNLRVHGTAGRAFTPPEASQFTGRNESIVAKRTVITQGNPNLQPETSIGWDIGLGWNDDLRSADLTYFETIVEDKIASVVTSRPAAPAPIINSYVNADSSFANGLEFQARHAITPVWSLFGNTTWFFERTEKIRNLERNTLNVADITANVGLDFELGPFSSRVSGRYVGHRNDFNFNLPTRPMIQYPSFMTMDFSANYNFYKGHNISLQASNLLDKYYFEKLGFPLAGRQLNLIYSFNF